MTAHRATRILPLLGLAALGLVVLGLQLPARTEQLAPAPGNISAGQLPGGLGTVTGAVKNNGSGTFTQAACGDLTNGGTACQQTYTAFTAWTPTDQSGAALTFTSISAKFAVIGSICIVEYDFTFPTTASAAATQISLPCTFNGVAQTGVFPVLGNTSAIFASVGVSSATTFGFISNTLSSATQVTNATLSTLRVRGTLVFF